VIRIEKENIFSPQKSHTFDNIKGVFQSSGILPTGTDRRILCAPTMNDFTNVVLHYINII